MDELTRERYPHGVPWRELLPWRQPPATPDEIAARRIVLCGTADLNVVDDVQEAALKADRRLVAAIREWQR